jgi:hypothetical protein
MKKNAYMLQIREKALKHLSKSLFHSLNMTNYIYKKLSSLFKRSKCRVHNSKTASLLFAIAPPFNWPIGSLVIAAS